MKKAFLGLTVILIAAVCAFSTKAELHKVRGTLFQLNDISQPHNPAAYSALAIDPTVDCPGAQRICVIDVPTSDIHVGGSFNGKPKVDVNTVATTDLYDDIDEALSDPADGLTQNGRVIYEKQP